ncbi:hypothetical protein WSM22_45740 [Cytophagales bacterium WSM2-2]|nr:hypothetical protein WSM22_45740 [Cytophagales bacterium WSM2-2]
MKKDSPFFIFSDKTYITSKLKGIKVSNSKKVILISAAIIVFLMGLSIVFISPIVRYLVESSDQKYTGRQVTMDWAYVNPFTGFVQFNNFKVYEYKKDTLFFSANHVSADFALLKLFSNTVEITELIVDQPRGTVTNTKKHFNFDDLISRFSSDTLSLKKSSTHINILNVKVRHGEFVYREKAIPINYIIRDLNMESSGKRWDADTIASTFSFLSQNGKGGIKGDFTINARNLDYRLATSIRNFDLEIIRQYLWELINYGMFSAQVDATIRATGNFKNPERINAIGRVAFNDFHLGKTTRDDYLAFEKLIVVIDQLNPYGQKFLFDSVVLRKPVFKYQKFDSLNNVEMLFGEKGSNISDVTSQSSRFNLVIEIGRYLKRLSRNFFQSHYRVNHLVVTQGDLAFSDFSLNEQFNISANSLSIISDSIDRNNKRVGIYIKSGIKPFGDLSVTLSVNPKDSGDFDMYYHLNKISATTFNPYLVSYTSFPLDRGTIELNGTWNVRNAEVKSTNHLVIVDPRISSRIRTKHLKWIPLPLVMAFVRERGNVIDYNIPITGNLKDPHFHLRDVTLDLIKNIFVKPVTMPYGIALRNAESEIEHSLTLKWEVRQHQLHHEQQNFIKTMAEFLDKNKTSSIAVYSNEYSSKEKEQILFFEAKKKYTLSLRARNEIFTKDDSIKIDRMSVKDAAFMHSLKRGRGAGDTLMFTIQDKCNYYIDSNAVNLKYRELVKERDRVFRDFFARNGTLDRVKIHSTNDSIPYNGFSCYKIIYKGEVPKSLQRAFKKMHELNNEDPRKRYASNRKLSALK